MTCLRSVPTSIHQPSTLSLEAKTVLKYQSANEYQTIHASKVVVGRLHRRCMLICVALLTFTHLLVQRSEGQGGNGATGEDRWTLDLTTQRPTDIHANNYHRETVQTQWDPKKTAVILCDVWDSHHGLAAVRRVREVAPRLDQIAAAIRARGGTVIHAPSDCTENYANHPARERAQRIAIAPETPETISVWCNQIESETNVPYPVDQSDGGEDDDTIEHLQWAERLKSMGRDPKRPWMRQIETIQIDSNQDYISESGKEIWNILKARSIEHVLLCGVHTNMCVLGRPFGLRQLKQHGFDVVLVRDLTDTMYNPQRWPHVSHCSGTDRVIDHIERVVCPTTTSDQFLGGTPFRFLEDQRKHWVVMIGEDEYRTETTLVRWAQEQLSKDFRVSYVFARSDAPNQFVGLEALASADALLVSVRRRPLPPADLHRVRQFIASGKPVLGIRTASHAFSLRGKEPGEGLADWPEFDAEVFGGSYTNHYGNDLITSVRVEPQTDHPLIPHSERGKFLYESKGSLYRVSPLRPGTSVLWAGTIPNTPSEPVAWSFVRDDSGRSFYTSLGHESDFENDTFCTLLLNAAYWLTGSANRVTVADVEHQQHMVRRGKGKQR
jgi:nicotinamidase-related amidase/type 1 glutamine amidotransferase